VKLADLADNLPPQRLLALPEDERGIARRYSRAMEMLTHTEVA
jgi:hypothetical protein